jgi:hypothetical protein
MNQLTKFLVDSILNEGDESLSTVALFGGGFKPPTKGHLDVVLQGLRDNPEVKQVYILVGSGVRNGITQEESVKIWKIYKRFIPVSTQIVAVQSPFSYIKTYLQDHQDENVYIFIGARPDNDEDEKDVAERSAYAKKYSKKAFPVKVTTPGNISGTKARAAAKQSKEAFYQFIPDQLSIQDKEEIYNIILPTLNEVGEGSSKPYEWREDFDEYVFTTDSNVGYIVSLSEMSEGGKMGIAVEFLAKTPEMDGYSSKIEVGRGELFRVMATIIDIIKSHLSKNPEIEFILYSPSKKTGEGDIGNQRDKLYKIFLQKQIPGIRIRDIGTSAVIAYLPKRDELNLEINKPGDGNAAPYGSGYNKVDEKKDPKKGTGKKSKGSDNLNENASYSKDIDVKGKILELTKHMLAKGMNIKPLPKVKFVNGDSNNAREFLGKTAYYNPENQTITLYTEGRHPKDIVKSFSHEMIHHIQNLEDRLGDISTTNTMKDDHLDKLEQEANLKGTMTFRNWTDSLNESYGDPYEEIVVYTNDPSISVLPYLKGVILMNTLQKSGVKNLVQFLELKNIPYEINDNLEKQATAKKAMLPTLKKELINKLKSKYPNGFIGYLNSPLTSRQTPEYFKDNPTYSFPNITINKPGEYGGKNKFQIKFKIEPQNLEKYINWFMYSPDSIEDLIDMDNYEGEELWLKGNIPIDTDSLNEANLKGTMTFRNWTDSLNEDLSNISLDYIKTKLPKLDSYPKSDIILSKGDFVYLEIPQDVNNPYSMVYEIKVFDIKDGTLIAQSSFDYDDNNKLKGTLDVRPDKRRMGIATEIYKLAEKIIGDTIFPEEKHTEDAEKFWRQKNRSFGPQNYDSLNESLYLDIPKFSQPKTFKQHLIESINEISLSKNNAVEINGDLTGGNFTVGDIIYEYSIKNIPNPYKELGLFYNIQFTPTGEIISTPQMGKENYIKILSTMYKIIVDFIEKEKPEYVGIASLDNNGKNYHQVYANLTDNKSNNIPGYFRKDVNLEFNTPEGKGRFIVLKKKDSLNEVKYTNPNFELEWEEAVRYPEFKEMGKENWIKVAKQGKLVNYSSIKDVLGNVDLDFDNLEEPKKQRFQSAFKNGTVETPIAVKFSDNDYDLVAGNTRLSGLIKNGVNPKIWVIDISNIQEKKNKDPFGLNQFAREIAEEVISEGRYDTLANKLSSIAFKAFKDIHDRGDKEGSFKFRVDTPDDEHDIPSEDFYFDFEGVVEITDGEYGVDGGANAGFDTDGNEITPLLSVKFKIPKNPSNIYPTWQDISFDIKDVIRHELEHLTQDGDNEKPGKYIEDDQLLRDLIDAKLLPKAQYFKLEKEIDAMLQGLYFKAKKLKRPYKKVIDDYLATQSITQEEKNDILKIWRSRAKSLSLPLFESEGISELFTIYLDIDGVIADFDKRFTELAGMGPREYEDSFGSEKFWDFIDIKHKIKFFSKMDWMPEGKKLYNFIKQFDHKLLSAPSKNDASKVGKRIWAKENTPETQLILSPAYNKKNYADKSNILIDDREKNIQQWKDAGGIGILFKSTDQVIDELKKIMNL